MSLETGLQYIKENEKWVNHSLLHYITTLSCLYTHIHCEHFESLLFYAVEGHTVNTVTF